MATHRRNPAYRRYMQRMAPLSIAYMAAVAAASRFIPHHAAASLPVVLLALLPGIVAIGWIWSMARLLVELDDEYLRMLEVRKFLIATGATLGLASAWGLVELFVTVPRIPVFFVFPIWCLGLFIGRIANKFIFGDGGCA